MCVVVTKRRPFDDDVIAADSSDSPSLPGHCLPGWYNQAGIPSIPTIRDAFDQSQQTGSAQSRPFPSSDHYSFPTILLSSRSDTTSTSADIVPYSRGTSRGSSDEHSRGLQNFISENPLFSHSYTASSSFGEVLQGQDHRFIVPKHYTPPVHSPSSPLLPALYQLPYEVAERRHRSPYFTIPVLWFK